MPNPDGLEVLAIIGIRSGSAGLVDKNIREIHGRPLVAWILDAARAARHVSRVVVSTDSERYASVARAQGAQTPCLRPDSLAGPDATDVEFIVHMLDHLERTEGYVPEVVLRLLATCPLQQADDIDAAVDTLIDDPDATASMVIAEARQHPAKAMRLRTDANGRDYLVPWVGDRTGPEPVARQRHTPAYFRANIVASRIETIRRTGTLTGERVAFHEVPQDRSIDIDSPTDFVIAEALLQLRDRAHTPSPGQRA